MLEGKVALITGGASGIGRAACLKFAAYGAQVVVADLEGAGAEETARLIVSAGGTALAIRADISEEAQVEEMVAFTLRRLDRLDCAFNNAGIGLPPMSAADLTQADWRKAIDVDLIGAWLCMKYELRHMAEVGCGAIVNTASLAGLGATPGRSPYAAAKAGLINLTKTVAIEYAQKGIRVNAICPGVIMTEPARKWAAAGIDFVKDLQVPMARAGEPEEIAEIAAWLASPLSSYITGQAICADGGISAR
jgi:NAD(P)-dependent dehydrogenase (short-subunit alcohol dehydrogenase family)